MSTTPCIEMRRSIQSVWPVVHWPVHSASLVVIALIAWSPIYAALVIEPVFNRVDGSGPAENNFPLYDPEFQVNGVSYWVADEPGETVSYASGDPRDPILDVVHVWNNTQYALTGFTLRLIGTATDSEDPGTIVRGPVNATWGDVNGDSLVGVSDIFGTITVSPDGKEIRFQDGLIPVGGRFTDIHLAMSDNPPDFAGIDSSFTGILVPEPVTFGLSAFAVVWVTLYGRRKRRSRSRTEPSFTFHTHYSATKEIRKTCHD